MAFYREVEYIPDAKGVAAQVKCPLVDAWIFPIDCLENQSIKAEYIPNRFKVKSEWESICGKCPFRDY